MPDDIYESWKKWRAATFGRVPEDFSARAMERIGARETQRRTFAAWLVTAALPRLGRIAVCLLAALVGLLRMGQGMGAIIP